jgi:hypothetical protein
VTSGLTSNFSSLSETQVRLSDLQSLIIPLSVTTIYSDKGRNSHSSR